MAPEKKYDFSETIKIELIEVEKYLRDRKYYPETIRHYRNYIGMFLEWVEEQSTMPEAISYVLIKDFIFQLKKENSIKQINRILIAVSHYYDHLRLGINPVKGLRIRGERRNLQHHFIDYEDLENLYANYKRNYTLNDDRNRRNKVVLGLMIYQAITNKELHRLEEEHIKLREGKIYIKGTRNSNGRLLKLEVNQLLDLQEYLLVVRPRMLEAIENGSYLDKPGRKTKKIDPNIYKQVFFSESGSALLKNSLVHLFRNVKKIYPKVSSGKVIRGAVISHWLKQYDIRQVQYMAGHKFVSSTERYELLNLEELEEALRKLHPLR